jgi:hypothetical protein
MRGITPVIIVVIYNHPKTKKQEFLTFLQELLLLCNIFDMEVIIVGDLNFDLMKTNFQMQDGRIATELDSDGMELLDHCYSFNLEQLIRVPTRINQ